MKLSRLLAALAMVVAGVVVVPTPAAADRLVPERPLRLEALSTVCTVLNGTLRREVRAVACDLRGGTIACEESCQYLGADLRELPPLEEACLEVRGVFSEIVVGHLVCDLKEGDVIVDCAIDATYAPWWFRPANELMVCDEVGWIPLDQNMS